ncbi:MAG TPA: prepilin peptidase [Methylomirabilota bacterium]|nr:prepilin peptidase [Methylomirabilota bacterium]
MITPSQEYRRTSFHIPGRVHKGLDAKVNSLIGARRRRNAVIRDLRRDAELIEREAAALREMPEQQLKQKMLEFRQAFRRRGRDQAALTISALAAIREAADRQLGLRAFPVQLMGALALQRGHMAEMATGEGKTLTAGLAAVLVGWTKRPCHIITVNDYLVQRDAEWLKPLYDFCGVSVGYVTGAMKPADRRHGYNADITYTTSKEVVADFLRDRLQLGGIVDPTRRLIRTMLIPQQRLPEGLVMRGLDTAIIDEADSVLIDEAVTPLIISAPHENDVLREAALIANEIAKEMQADVDYLVDTQYREVNLTDAGMEKLQAKCQGRDGLWRGSDRRLDLIKQALVAREFFIKGKQYVVQDGKVVIVDEFTGRPMPQRTWRQGLHQAIEAKEGVKISDPSETVARLSFQRYFRFYRQISGMTGTGAEAADEFWQIYNLPAIRIPTNKPCVREQWPDRIFATETEKHRAIVEEVQRVHATGRPILIGTRTVKTSEKIAELLDQVGLPHRLLNATRLSEEAAIISEAGERGRITLSTNMAGRGTDIKLGEGVAELGGLHVIATERHESQRVDRQLFGRAGRQGDPGSAQAFISLEDELLNRYLPKVAQERVRKLFKSGLPGSKRFAGALVSFAQRRAQTQAFKARKNVLRMDDWLDEALSFAGPSIA